MGQIDHNVGSDRFHAHSYSTHEVYPSPIEGIHTLHKGKHFDVHIIEHQDDDGVHHICFSQTEGMHKEGGLGIDFHPAALATRWYNEATQEAVGKKGFLKSLFAPVKNDIADIEKRNLVLSPEDVRFYLHHPAGEQGEETFKAVALTYKNGAFVNPVISENLEVPQWVHDALPTAENLNHQPSENDQQHDHLSF